MKRPVGLLAVTLCLLSACVDGTNGIMSNFGGGEKTANEIALEKEAKEFASDSRKIVVQNVLQGAAVGALAGCGLALLTGEDCRRSAAAGAVAGGIGGAVAGSLAADANTELEQQKSIVANLKSTGQSLSKIETRLNQVVAAQRKEVAMLNARVKANEISDADRSARLKAINHNRAVVAAALESGVDGLEKTNTSIISFEGNSGKSMSRSKKVNRAYLAKTRKMVSAMKKTLQ